MPHRLRCPARLPQAALGMRWLVLLVILFGSLVSSVGYTNSHGIAAIAAALHAEPSQGEHAHSHDDEGHGWETAGHGTGPGHSHHGPDHSHDKAHALPAALRSAARHVPPWNDQVRAWVELVQASRLERPPMG